jgi:hypothetical protein
MSSTSIARKINSIADLLIDACPLFSTDSVFLSLLARTSLKNSLSLRENLYYWRVMGRITPDFFGYDFSRATAMTTAQDTAIKISSKALEHIAAGGGHATLYLVPRPAADG